MLFQICEFFTIFLCSFMACACAHERANLLLSLWVNTSIRGETMKRFNLYIAAVALSAFGSISLAAADTGFVTGQVLGALRGNYTGQIGLRFTVGKSPVTLTGLGRWVLSGNSSAHTLTLVRESDLSILGSVSVPTLGATAGAFKYVSLASPVTLAANTTYYIMSSERSGADLWYNDEGTVVTTTAVATVNNSEWNDGSGYHGNIGGAHSYVPVSFTYSINAAAPVPSVKLSASPASITNGTSSTLTWSSTNATSCMGSGFMTSATSGSAMVAPNVKQIYTFTCTGPGGTASASTTVTVNPAGQSLPFGTPCPAGGACSYIGAPQYTQETITCSGGGVMTVASASFGAPQGSESCLSYAQSMCNGKPSCSFSFFGNCGPDPAPGFAKTGNISVTCSSSTTASPSGTTIPPAGQIVDSRLGKWTLNNGAVYLNGSAASYSANVVLILYYSNTIYHSNSSGGWWSWTGSAWSQVGGDPRKASFYHSVAASGTNVSISPIATQSVPSGARQTYVVTPNPGYLVSGKVAGTCPAGTWSGSSYATGAITGNCSLSFSASLNSNSLIPPQAAAAGYNVNTFNSTFTAAQIDMGVTGNAGYQWYIFNWNVNPNANGITRDGGGLHFGPSIQNTGYQANVSTFYGLSNGAWHGTAFGGGGYFEAIINFNASAIKTQNGWPSFWSMALENVAVGRANVLSAQWIGQAAGYKHYTEVDFFEYINNGNTNSYYGTVHDDWGIYNVTCPGWCSVQNGNNQIVVPSATNWSANHRVGTLWVPATPTTDGYIANYFDGALTTKISWKQYANQSPSPAGAPWEFGVTDKNHLVLFLGTGTGQEFNILSVNVWQTSAANNISQ